MIKSVQTVLGRAFLKKREAHYVKRFAEQNAAVDRFILSYPKSGRNWHRVMLGFYLARVTGRKDADALDFKTLRRLAGLPLFKYSHNGTNLSAAWTAASHCVASPTMWRSRPVLLLVREPKAILVSAFHHVRFRKRSFDGTLSEFIRDPRWGIDKIATAYQRWHSERHQAAEFVVASYEQMSACPEQVLRKTLTFVGVPAQDEALISEAIRFGRYENMKQYYETDFFQHRRMRKKRPEDPPQASKVREGTRDSYKAHLSEEDSAYIDQRIAHTGGNPFAAEIGVPS